LELCRAWQGWTFEVIGAVGVDLGVSALAGLSAARVSLVEPQGERIGQPPQGQSQTGEAACPDRHQLTTDLIRRFHSIGTEDFNVRGMVDRSRPDGGSAI